LLRVLQSGEITSVGGRRGERVDVRILAATHRDLEAEVRAGRFRDDLLYRLRVVPIHIPPLRERPEDTRALAEYFVTRYAKELGSRVRWLSDDAMERLLTFEWPGNVRELENAVKRALVLSTAEVLTLEDFAFLDGGGPEEPPEVSLEELVRREAEAALEKGEVRDLYRRLLERAERPLLEAVLARTGGNQLRAASVLGINRNTLRKKIGELRVRLPERS
jgi:two-component system nitrogen regulation response regulator GlnG